MSEQEQPVGEFVVYSTDDGELDEGGTCKDYLQVRQEGKRRVQRTVRHYNLEAILAAGFRVC